MRLQGDMHTMARSKPVIPSNGASPAPDETATYLTALDAVHERTDLSELVSLDDLYLEERAS